MCEKYSGENEVKEQITIERTTTERLEITTLQQTTLKAAEYLTRSGYKLIDSKFIGGTPSKVKVIGEKVVTTEPQIISAVALDARMIGG